MPNMPQMDLAKQSKAVSAKGPAKKSAGTGSKYPSNVRTDMAGQYEGGVAGQTKLNSLARRNRG
jgi:hypothetical protein